MRRFHGLSENVDGAARFCLKSTPCAPLEALTTSVAGGVGVSALSRVGLTPSIAFLLFLTLYGTFVGGVLLGLPLGQ